MARRKRSGKTRRKGKGDDGSRSLDLALLGALFLGSFILRLLLLNDGLFHHDSVVLAQAVELSQETGRLQPMLLQIPPVAGRYGLVLVNWLLYSFARGFGATSAEPVLLLSAALFGSLAVATLYTIARELRFSRMVAVAAGMLLSLSPIFFSETVGAKGHGLALWLVLAAVYWGLRSARTGSAALAAVAALLVGASGFVRMSSLFAAVPIALMLILESSDSRRRALPTFLVVILGAVAALVAVQWTWIQAFAGVTDYRILDLRVMGAAFGDLGLSLSIVGVVFLVAGVVVSLPDRRTWALALWLVGAFLYTANLGQYSPRFLIEPIAMASLFVAAGLGALLGRWPVVFWFATAALALTPFIRTWEVIAYRHDRIGNKEVALYLRDHTPPDAVVIAMDDAPFVQYYGKRSTMLHPIGDPEHLTESKREIGVFVQQVGNLIVSGRRVYLLKTGLLYDPGELVSRLLNANFEVVEVARMESEDYHHNSIRSGRYEQVIYELKLKEG